MPKSKTSSPVYVPSIDETIARLLWYVLGINSGFQQLGHGGRAPSAVDTVTQLSLMLSVASTLPKSFGEPVVAALKTAIGKAAISLSE